MHRAACSEPGSFPIGTSLRACGFPTSCDSRPQPGHPVVYRSFLHAEGCCVLCLQATTPAPAAVTPTPVSVAPATPPATPAPSTKPPATPAPTATPAVTPAPSTKPPATPAPLATPPVTPAPPATTPAAPATSPGHHIIRNIFPAPKFPAPDEDTLGFSCCNPQPQPQQCLPRLQLRHSPHKHQGTQRESSWVWGLVLPPRGPPSRRWVPPPQRVPRPPAQRLPATYPARLSTPSRDRGPPSRRPPMRTPSTWCAPEPPEKYHQLRIYA